MQRYLTVLAAGLVVSGWAVSSAMAQDGFVVPDMPYELGIDVGVVYVSLPKVNGFAYSVDHDNYDFIRQYDHPTANRWLRSVGLAPLRHARSRRSWLVRRHQDEHRRRCVLGDE